MIFQKKTKIEHYISIDLGTVNTIVYVSSQGIVYNEPSVIAYRVTKDMYIPFEIGTVAAEMVGKNHAGIKIIKPLTSGVIDDLDTCIDLIKMVFNRIRLLNVFTNSVILLACPSGISELEKYALKELALSLGASKVFVEEEAKMAAIGAGIDIKPACGNLIVDVGGGTTDIALISAGDVVVSSSIKVAGNNIDEEIIKYLRSKYNIVVGSQTAERIKIKCGSLTNDLHIDYTAYGRDVMSGLPKSVVIKSSEITKIVIDEFSKIIDLIAEVMEASPSELSADVFLNGITFSGGGSLFKGLKEYVSAIFQIPVHISKHPLLGVIEGTKRYEVDIMKFLEDSERGFIDPRTTVKLV